MASLVGLDGRKFQLPSGKSCSIGRSADNDIVLPHRSVSRHHAMIQNDGRDYFLKDLNSSNGTWVGSRRIAAAIQLTAGDELRFGNLKFSFDGQRPVIGRGDSADRAAVSKQRSVAAFHARTGRAMRTFGAFVALAIVGFGAWEFIVHWSAGNANGTTSALIPSEPKQGQVPRDSSPSAHTGGTGPELPAQQVARAVLETDRKNAGRGLWISMDSIANVCNRGTFPSESVLCREAYFARHAEGKDLDKGPQGDQVSAADVAEFCTRGTIDSNSSICAEVSKVPHSREVR